jgi:hypothetical protein
VDPALARVQGGDFARMPGALVAVQLLQHAEAVDHPAQAPGEHGEDRADAGEQEHRRHRLLDHVGDSGELGCGFHGSISA